MLLKIEHLEKVFFSYTVKMRFLFYAYHDVMQVHERFSPRMHYSSLLQPILWATDFSLSNFLFIEHCFTVTYHWIFHK